MHCGMHSQHSPLDTVEKEKLELYSGVYHCFKHDIASLLSLFREHILGYLKCAGQSRGLFKYDNMGAPAYQPAVLLKTEIVLNNLKLGTLHAATELRHQLPL